MLQTRFGELVRMRRERAAGLGIQPPPLDQSELERVVICPLCGKKMETFPYYGPGNIVIDVCSGCQVVWLDSGELRAIESAPGSDRGGQALKLHWRQATIKRHAEQSAKLEEKLRKKGLIWD
jgi:Zn-finger nucleic acid-binding protein